MVKKLFRNVITFLTQDFFDFIKFFRPMKIIEFIDTRVWYYMFLNINLQLQLEI